MSVQPIGKGTDIGEIDGITISPSFISLPWVPAAIGATAGLLLTGKGKRASGALVGAIVGTAMGNLASALAGIGLAYVGLRAIGVDLLKKSQF